MKQPFPLYRQHDIMQCGVACLAMICKYYGKAYSQDALSKICNPTMEGMSMYGVRAAAVSLGLQATCVKVSCSNLSEEILPCILHWNQNHFVVLYKIKNGKVFYIADPAKGLCTYSLVEFKKHWISIHSQTEGEGIAMLFQPTKDFYRQQAETSRERRSFRFLLDYLKRYHRYFGQIIIGLFMGCLLQLIFPFLTQAIVDIGIKQQNLSFIYLILIGQLMLTVSRTAIDFIRRWLLLHISMRINISLESDFFIKLLKLPMSFFDTKLIGDLMQRMNDHSRVEKFLTNHLLNIMFSLFSFVVFGCVLFYYNLSIFGVFLIASMIYGGWTAFFLQRRKKLDYELFEKQAENNNKTYQLITTMQEIKLQDCEQRRRWEWEDVQADLFDIQSKMLKMQQAQQAGSIFINEIKNVFITFLAATSVIHGNMTLGMMLAVQYVIGQLNSPVEQLMNFIYTLQEVKISLERINDIHGREDEDNGKREVADLNKMQNDIILENVEFKYDPHNPKNTINQITMTIPHGKVTAIVGASGSGKTTLVKLMLGYYPVMKGTICIGSTNINNVNLKSWRKKCGVVMQDGVIFSESISRNIAVDDNNIDKERLLKAAVIANIKDYIMGLPLSFNTKIGGDGINLSEGQKQRILIARAVYKNPRYIFLDEATNSLDAENERVIVDNLNCFYKGRTVVVIAHRLSTVKKADQIIVLENGRIAETGNHTNLIERKGAYYNLVKNQLELGN